MFRRRLAELGILALAVVAVLGTMVFVALAHRQAASSDTNDVAYFAFVLTAVTLLFVGVQVYLALIQIRIADRQTLILERQDSFMYGTTNIEFWASEAADIGTDELIEIETLTLFAENRGERLVRGFSLRLALPPVFTPVDVAWRRFDGRADVPESYTIWQRDFPDELWPNTPTPIGEVLLKRTLLEQLSSYVPFTQAESQGHISPAPGKFEPLVSRLHRH